MVFQFPEYWDVPRKEKLLFNRYLIVAKNRDPTNQAGLIDNAAFHRMIADISTRPKAIQQIDLLCSPANQ
jgi:hypothetical protein